MKKIFIFIALIILLTSCFNKSNLNGTWKVKSDEEIKMDIISGFIFGPEITFQDGKLITSLGMAYDYEVKKDIIYVDLQGISYLFKKIDSRNIELDFLGSKILYQKE